MSVGNGKLCTGFPDEKLILTICLTLVVLLGSTGTSWGADFNKGLAAAQSGDFETALREWRPLAEQGYAPAQTNLGRMYRQGAGVPKDDETAAKLYTLAAKQGLSRAQTHLGFMYEKGRGVPQDHKIAVKLYRLAAEQGNSSAQRILGLMYVKGLGVIQDNVFAHMWWNIAASSGNKDAVKNRDKVAKQMTPAAIAEAEKLARECVAKKYKGC